MGFWIASLTFIILSFIAMISFGRINYQNENKTKYSFLNMFPYELSNVRRGTFLNFYRFFLYLYIAFSLTPALLLFSKYQSFSSLSTFLIFINVLIILQTISFLSLNIIEARFIKVHTIIATLYFGLSILSSGGVAIFLMNLYFSSSDPLLRNLILGIAFVVIGLLFIVVMLNPKLKTWPELESAINEDGTQSLRRPKFFILAFSEWIAILLNLVAQILLLIAYL